MSIRKRTWITKGVVHEAWVVDHVDAGGTRRLKTFARKKEADAFAATSKVDIAKGIYVADRASTTIAQAGELWIKSGEAAGLERTTLGQYRIHLKLHIVPFIGAMRLNQLSPAVVRSFEDRLREEGRSAILIRKVMTSLGGILADASDRGLVARNVIRERGRRRRGSEARRGGRLTAGVDIPLPHEVKAIVGAAQGRWRPLLITAIFTGLRASELRGLRWADVDLAGALIHVKQRADQFHGIGKPKTEASERSVPLPPIVVNTLREWRLACPKGELDLVFPTGAGKVESLGNIRVRGLIPTLKAAGIDKPYGMHSFRHFYASWCINPRSAGGLELPMKIVQARLGHSSLRMTADVYGHLFPQGDDHEALATGERALLG